VATCGATDCNRVITILVDVGIRPVEDLGNLPVELGYLNSLLTSAVPATYERSPLDQFPLINRQVFPVGFLSRNNLGNRSDRTLS